MRQIRTIILPSLALLAVAVAGASTTLAASTNNPQFSLCVEKVGGKLGAGCEKAGSGFETKSLGEGESKEVTAKTTGVDELHTAGVTIQMKKLKFVKGAALKGSKMPNPGTTSGTIEYEELAVKGAPECKFEQSEKVVTTLKTNPLIIKLAFPTKADAEKEEGETVSVLEPASGKVLMEFKLTGPGCPTPSPAKVEGDLVMENVNGSKYGESRELKAPATSIEHYFVNEGGKTVEKTAELSAFGEKAGFFIIIIIVIVVLLLFALTAR
jgi:hypothetical protein